MTKKSLSKREKLGLVGLAVFLLIVFPLVLLDVIPVWAVVYPFLVLVIGALVRGSVTAFRESNPYEGWLNIILALFIVVALFVVVTVPSFAIFFSRIH